MSRQETTQLRKAQRVIAGRRVQALRTARGFSQKQLAEAVGVPQSTISNIEGGNRGMPPDQRVAIAKALRVSPESLDPASSPDLNLVALATQVDVMSEHTANLMALKLPPGLEGYLERHPDISPRIRWYLENSSFRTEPWVVFDDDFWDEVADFWERYLRQKEGAGGRGAKGGGTPPKS